MAKTTFWNAEVHIPQKMYQNSASAMCILRVLGLFPLQLKRKSGGLFLKFSFLYALYSCALGASTLGAMFYRIYQEFNVEKKPTHVVKTTDIFVRFSTIVATYGIVFYAIFIMPSRLLQFLKYIKYSGQVDSLINTTFSKSNRYKSIFMLTMPLICSAATDALDFYKNYKLNQAPLRNLSYYTTYIVALAVICINRYMANCLEIRVVQMNSILEEEYLNIKRYEAFFNRNSAVSRASHFSEDDVSPTNESPPVCLSHCRASIAITKVARAYLKWAKAANIVTGLFGIIVTMAMVISLSQLVAAKYFIILALEGRDRDIVEVLDWIAIFSVQILKLLWIIEPWHSCVGELENLKRQVCNLLSLNADRCCQEKIGSLAMILCLCPYQFSACGLFVVDRLLYTTLIDTVVTFLVISLQAEEEDTA